MLLAFSLELAPSLDLWGSNLEQRAKDEYRWAVLSVILLIPFEERKHVDFTLRQYVIPFELYSWQFRKTTQSLRHCFNNNEIIILLKHYFNNNTTLWMCIKSLSLVAILRWDLFLRKKLIQRVKEFMKEAASAFFLRLAGIKGF